MKKVLLILLTSIFLFTSVFAICEDGQIDINSASKEKLDELYGIGPAKAQAIIDTRPFGSIDNLIDVVGIGEITLANIKQQGLACVEEEQENTQEEEDEEIKEEENSEDKEQEEIGKEEAEKETEYLITNIQEIPKITGENTKTIVLNPKDIKSEIDKEQLNENKLAIYGLIVFTILLVLLFGLKKRQKDKNEFK